MERLAQELGNFRFFASFSAIAQSVFVTEEEDCKPQQQQQPQQQQPQQQQHSELQILRAELRKAGEQTVDRFFAPSCAADSAVRAECVGSASQRSQLR